MRRSRQTGELDKRARVSVQAFILFLGKVFGDVEWEEKVAR